MMFTLLRTTILEILMAAMLLLVINGVYHSEIFGETYVGQNIWAPYMTQALAGTPVEAVSNANIGASIPQRGATPTPNPSQSAAPTPSPSPTGN